MQPRFFVLKSYNQSKRDGDLRRTRWKAQSRHQLCSWVCSYRLTEGRPNFLKGIQQLTGLGLPDDEIRSQFGGVTDRFLEQLA